MFLKATTKEVSQNSFTNCKRKQQLALYNSIAPKVYTSLLLKLNPEKADEVLLKVFVRLFDNIESCNDLDDVEDVAFKLSEGLIS